MLSRVLMAWLAGSSVFLFFMSDPRRTSWSEVILGVLVMVTAPGPLSERHVPAERRT